MNRENKDKIYTESFKEVQLGPKSVEIPTKWEVIKVKKIASVNYGKSLPNSSGAIPAVGSSGVFAQVNEALTQSGTLVVGRKGSAGQAYLIDEPSWPIDTTFYLDSLKNGEIDLKYLHYHMIYRSLVKELEQTTLPSLKRERLENYQILTPPLPEQKKIAEILSIVDEAIKKTEEIIEQTKELKKGLMQDLLTKGIGHEEYKEVQLGPKKVEIPEEWKIKTFREATEKITDYVANGSFADLRENVEYKDKEDYAILLRLVDYSNNFEGDFVYIDEHAYEYLSKSKVKPGDIILSNIGANLGTAFRAPDLGKPMSIGPNAILIKGNYSNDFLYYWLDSEQGKKTILSIATKTAQRKFNKTEMRDLQLPIPPKSEQDEIVEKLNAVDEKIRQEEEYKEKLEELKKGLMQDLLTGEVRVLPLLSKEEKEAIEKADVAG